MGGCNAAQASRNAANTVFDTKRLMGRSYRGVLPELQHLPYRVLERHTRPVIAVQYRGEQHEFAPGTSVDPCRAVPPPLQVIRC